MWKICFFGFFHFFRISAPKKKGRQVCGLPVEPGRRSVWARGGACNVQRHRKSFEVQKNTVHFFTPFSFFLHLKRKGKMKTCMLLYVILHICNFYVILIFAYVHLCNHTFGGGLGAAVRLPCGPTPRNKSCKWEQVSSCRTWHRGILSQVIAVNFGKAWLSGKKAVGQKPAFFHFTLFFSSLDFFTWTCRDASVSQAQSQKEDMQHSTITRNHQNLLNLLNYSNTYSNHFLHAASSCSQRPITIHCPSMTHALPSSLSLPSALCCPEVFSSRFYENIRTMFSTLVRIWFLHVSKVFFSWGASRHLWQRFCVAVFDLALQGWHTVTLTHTPRRHKRHRIVHKTTRQAWLKKCKKIREDTTNVWILVMLYFT